MIFKLTNLIIPLEKVQIIPDGTKHFEANLDGGIWNGWDGVEGSGMRLYRDETILDESE